MTRSALLAALAVGTLVAGAASAQQRAFAEAEGYGQFATGGRGGDVYHVTRLDDNGSAQGTLRHGIETASGPRTIVFDVGGYITLNSKLGVTRDNITIAGQTAPGGGIGIKGNQFSVGADNIIVRHVRFRPGRQAGRVDSLSVSSGQNLIFDHVSTAFSYDENLSANGSARNLTVQNSNVAYGLVDHSAGSLLQGGQNFSFHHNLYAHNHTRNPKARIDGGGIDWVGNTVYDYNNGFIAGDSDTSDFFWKANLDGNTFITGPGDTGRVIIKEGRERNYGLFFGTNAHDNDGDSNHDPTLYTGNGVNANGLGDVVSGSYTWSATPYGDSPVRLEETPQQAYERVLAQVGATPWMRDEVDTLVVSNVVNRTGTLIDREGDIAASSPDEFPSDNVVSNGGFGTLATGTAPIDTDRDGMPDAYESAVGLNPSNAADRNNIAPTGYTNLEVYLNEIGARHDGTAWRAAGGNWEQDANWSDGQPGLHDIAFIDGQVTVSNAQRVFRASIGDGNAGAETLLINDGGLLDVLDSVTVGNFGVGQLQIDAGGTLVADSVLIANGNGGFNAVGGGDAGSGTVTLDGGTLATTRIATLDGNGGGSLNITNGGTVVALRDLTVLSDATLGTGGGIINTDGNAGVVTGTLSGSGSLTKRGGGELVLAADNTYTGGTVVNAGTVTVSRLSNIGAAGNLGNGSLTLDGGTLRIASSTGTNRGFDVGPAGGTLSTAFGQTVFFTGDINALGRGNRTLIVDLAGASNSSSNLGGAISDPSPGSGGGSLSLVKTGAARLFIGGNGKTSTYSGDTVIDEGALYLNFSLSNATPIPFGFNKGNVFVNSGATLGLLNNNLQINGLSGGGTVGQFANNTRTLTLGHGDAFGNFTGTIDGSGLALNKVGAGTQTLTGANTYARGTTLRGGALETGFLADGGAASSIGQSSADAANLVLDGGGLRYTGPGARIDRNFTLTANGGRIDAHGTGNLEFRDNGGIIAQSGTGDRALFLGGTSTGFNTLDLALTDPAGGRTTLIKDGPGTWRLLSTDNPNTYSGDTIVAGGTLLAFNSGVLPTGAGRGNVVLFGGGTLNLNNQSHVLNGLYNGPANTAPGSIIGGSNSRTLTVGNGDADGFYSGTLSGTGLALRKIGTGNQVLGGTNTFARGTSVEGGTLTVISDDALSTGNVTVGLNATLDLSDTALTDAVSDAATVSLFRTETASSLVDFGNGGLHDVIAALFVNGQNLGDGIYNAQTLPGLITGNGSFRVGNIIPEPTTATLLLSITTLLLRRPRANACNVAREA